MAQSLLLRIPAEDVPDLAGMAFEEIPGKRMQGSVEIVDLIVTLSAAVTPLLAAFLTRPSRSRTGKRRVIINREEKVFENLTAREVAAVLDAVHRDPTRTSDNRPEK